MKNEPPYCSVFTCGIWKPLLLLLACRLTIFSVMWSWYLVGLTRRLVLLVVVKNLDAGMAGTKSPVILYSMVRRSCLRRSSNGGS